MPLLVEKHTLLVLVNLYHRCGNCMMLMAAAFVAVTTTFSMIRRCFLARLLPASLVVALAANMSSIISRHVLHIHTHSLTVVFLTAAGWYNGPIGGTARGDSRHTHIVLICVLRNEKTTSLVVVQSWCIFFRALWPCGTGFVL